jgi:hypothetical protein
MRFLLVTAAALALAPAAAASISLDQAEPIQPGTAVSFTVTNDRANFVEVTCGSATDPYSETGLLPVTDGSAGPYLIPIWADLCSAYALDQRQRRIVSHGGYVLAAFCIAQPNLTCFSD